MKLFAYIARGAAFSLVLIAAACMNDSGGDGGVTPPDTTGHGPDTTGHGSAQGTFRVSMSGPSFLSSTGSTSMSGTIYRSAQPANLGYKDGLKSGSCILKISEAPSCSPGCTGGAICVAVGAATECQAQPKSVHVGQVTVTGLKDREGDTTFSSTATDTIRNNYQVPSETILVFPPCAEGAPVTLAAAGSSKVGAFTVATKGIAPLVVAEGEVKLEDGKPLVVEWTPPAQAGSKMQVEVNITNHGGHKGKIACEPEDNGRLEIAANLVDGLKAMGVSGFPTVELTRYAKGTSAQVKVDLVIEQKIVKDLTIPGIISCPVSGQTGDCPDGKTCSDDLVCE